MTGFEFSEGGGSLVLQNTDASDMLMIDNVEISGCGDYRHSVVISYTTMGGAGLPARQFVAKDLVGRLESTTTG